MATTWARAGSWPRGWVTPGRRPAAVPRPRRPDRGHLQRLSGSGPVRPLAGRRHLAATLAHNDSGRFGVALDPALAPSGALTFRLDAEPIELPVAHGEGKFLSADPAVPRRSRSRDSDSELRRPTMRPTRIPGQPEWIAAGRAGVCDSSGRIFGLMPHPERYSSAFIIRGGLCRATQAGGDGLPVFRNAVTAFS